MYLANVTIPHPDDPTLPPVYEGFVGDAHTRLVPGLYRGIYADDVTGMVDTTTGDDPEHDVMVRVIEGDAYWACVNSECTQPGEVCPDHGTEFTGCVCADGTHERFADPRA